MDHRQNPAAMRPSNASTLEPSPLAGELPCPADHELPVITSPSPAVHHGPLRLSSRPATAIIHRTYALPRASRPPDPGWLNQAQSGGKQQCCQPGQRDNEADAAYEYEPSRHGRCKAPRYLAESNHRATAPYLTGRHPSRPLLIHGQLAPVNQAR